MARMEERPATVSDPSEADLLAFPYGVAPDVAVDEATSDERGADTINRVLLHGARYHERDGVFLDWTDLRGGGRGWERAPDWRADRSAIRAGLVLRQRLGIDRGDTVAMWMPFGANWLAIERGVWSLGAVSAPLPADWPISRVRDELGEIQPAALFAPTLERFESLRMIDGIPSSVLASIHCGPDHEDPDDSPEVDDADPALSLDRFLDYGGVLDTPERASMWRTGARSIRPSDAASREITRGGACMLSQGDWVGGAQRFLERVPADENRIFLLANSEPHTILRLLAYAGWADGRTSLAFAGTAEAQAEVGGLNPDLIACTGDRLTMLRDSARDSTDAGSARPRVVVLKDADQILDADGPGFLDIALLSSA